LELTFFKMSEFDSPDEVGSGYKMDRKLLIKLDTAAATERKREINL